MEHQMIAAIVAADARARSQDSLTAVREQQRKDALRARSRTSAARARAQWRLRMRGRLAGGIRRMRATLARGIHRVAETVEPPRQVCAVSATDSC